MTDECAVFASATAEAGGDGTKAKPYASLGEAVANAKGKRVLACASGAFAESVTIEAEVEVIGGFDCGAEWTWSEEARSAIEGPAGAVALTLGEGRERGEGEELRGSGGERDGAGRVVDRRGGGGRRGGTGAGGRDRGRWDGRRERRDADGGAAGGSERAGGGVQMRATRRIGVRWRARRDDVRGRRDARWRRWARRDHGDRRGQRAEGCGWCAAAGAEPGQVRAGWRRADRCAIAGGEKPGEPGTSWRCRRRRQRRRS